MDLSISPAFSVKCPARLEPFTQFDTPNSTVTVLIDHRKGVMEIWAEHEVDPLDWDIVAGLIARMGIRDIGVASYVKGVDTWHIQIRPDN